MSYSCNRSWRPIGFWDVKYTTFSRQSFTDGGDFVSFTRRLHSTSQQYYLLLISVRSRVNPRAMARLERLGNLKKFNDHIGTQSRGLRNVRILNRIQDDGRCRELAFRFLRFPLWLNFFANIYQILCAPLCGIHVSAKWINVIKVDQNFMFPI
jgi:hypothetical protein